MSFFFFSISFTSRGRKNKIHTRDATPQSLTAPPPIGWNSFYRFASRFASSRATTLLRQVIRCGFFTAKKVDCYLNLSNYG